MEPFETLASTVNTALGESVTYGGTATVMVFSRAAQLGEPEIVGQLLASAPAALFSTAPAAGDQVVRNGVNYIVIGTPQLDPVDGTYHFLLNEVR